jgi:hypothetical protein
VGFGASSTNPFRYRSGAHLLIAQLGTLQHITISHIYDPECTSLTALEALAVAELTTLNNLLGTSFSLTAQTWTQLGATPHGSHGTQLKLNGVTLAWQALARIGDKPASPSTRLLISGSGGMVQASSTSNGYQLIDRQGRVVTLESQLSQALEQLPQRSFRQV